jgi:hypothetical protein
MPPKPDPNPDYPIVVLGDVNNDIVVFPCSRAEKDKKLALLFDWHEWPPHKWFTLDGGAWLVADVINAALGEDMDIPKDYAKIDTYARTHPSKPPGSPATLSDRRCPTSFAILTPCKQEPGSEKRVYRLDPKGVHGWVGFPVKIPPADADKKWLIELIKELAERCSIGSKPRLVVVHDLAWVFRGLKYADSLKGFLEGNDHFSKKGQKDGLILWRMSNPLPPETETQGTETAWGRIVADYPDQTVVVTNTHYLRNLGVDVRDDASIEHKTDCLLYHIENHPGLHQLAWCGRLIIRFDNGVFYYTKPPDTNTPACSFAEGLSGYPVLAARPL